MLNNAPGNYSAILSHRGIYQITWIGYAYEHDKFLLHNSIKSH